MVKLTLKPTEDPKFHLQPCERGKGKQERLEEAAYKGLTAALHNPTSQRDTSEKNRQSIQKVYQRNWESRKTWNPLRGFEK